MTRAKILLFNLWPQWMKILLFPPKNQIIPFRSFYQLIYHMVYDKSQDFTFQLMAPMNEDFTVPPKKSDHSIFLNKLWFCSLNYVICVCFKFAYITVPLIQLLSVLIVLDQDDMHSVLT